MRKSFPAVLVQRGSGLKKIKKLLHSINTVGEDFPAVLKLRAMNFHAVLIPRGILIPRRMTSARY